MPLNVLHISLSNLHGGVETVLAPLAPDRSRRPAMEPHFALRFEGRLSSELSALSTPASIIGPVRTRSPWMIVAAGESLLMLLNIFGQTLVFVTCRNLAIFGPLLAEKGVPLSFGCPIGWRSELSPGFADRCSSYAIVCADGCESTCHKADVVLTCALAFVTMAISLSRRGDAIEYSR
jgi:hypothetical protein